MNEIDRMFLILGGIWTVNSLLITVLLVVLIRYFS